MELGKAAIGALASAGKPSEAAEPHGTIIEKFGQEKSPEAHTTIRLYLRYFYLDKLMAKICYLIGAIATIFGAVEFILKRA